MPDDSKTMTRREFVKALLRGGGVLAVGGSLGTLFARREAHGGMVWQLDPAKCTQCGKCATECVLGPSAVKCVHEFAMCGYCELCFGYFQDKRPDNSETAENQRCPTNALQRTFVEDPYYQYVVNEAQCIGCGICVKGCKTFGNSSLTLQVRHDRCLNCNQCAIAAACPSGAFKRVPADKPYLLRTKKS